MTLRDKIVKALDPDPDVDAGLVAENLLGQVTKAELLPLLVDEVERVQRTRVRLVERRAFGQSVGGSAAVVSQRARPRLTEVYGEVFALYDGRRVSWGEATVEQHRERVERLRIQRQGLTRTIERHEEAIRTCEEHGVDRLLDVPGLAESVA